MVVVVAIPRVARMVCPRRERARRRAQMEIENTTVVVAQRRFVVTVECCAPVVTLCSAESATRTTRGFAQSASARSTSENTVEGNCRATVRLHCRYGKAVERQFMRKEGNLTEKKTLRENPTSAG